MTVGLRADSGSFLCPAMRGAFAHILTSAPFLSSSFTQIVKSSHLEINSVYCASLVIPIIEYSSDTYHPMHCVKPSPARCTIFLPHFAQANNVFLAKTLGEV